LLYSQEVVEYKFVTNFFSTGDTFEQVLHKIELDLMANLHFGFTEPIEVSIKAV